MPASASRPANTDTQAGAPPDSASIPLAACSRGKDRRQIDFDAVLREGANGAEQRLAARRRYRQLDIDVRPPGRDQTGLRHHFRNVVGKHFERDVTVGNGGNQFARVRRIVGDLRRLQERRIGGKAPDPGLFGHVPDLRLVGAIREQLDLQLAQCDRHGNVLPGGKSDVKHCRRPVCGQIRDRQAHGRTATFAS